MSDEGIRIIHNMVCVVCCTGLAITFNKWGLIFLACLFWVYKN